jgi:hypothetical protein
VNRRSTRPRGALRFVGRIVDRKRTRAQATRVLVPAKAALARWTGRVKARQALRAPGQRRPHCPRYLMRTMDVKSLRIYDSYPARTVAIYYDERIHRRVRLGDESAQLSTPRLPLARSLGVKRSEQTLDLIVNPTVRAALW